MNYPIIKLKSKREVSILRKHPWVFSGAIDKIILNEDEEDPVEGAEVVIHSNRNEFLGIGHFSTGSIAIRILSFEDTSLHQDFWNKRLLEAYNTRILLGLANAKTTSCYRLIHAEGDQLPGLIIDVYNGIAVIQAHSKGMLNSLEKISVGLQEVLGNNLEAIYFKNEANLIKTGLSSVKDGWYYKQGKEEELVLEHGYKFLVDFEKSQKTGFFIDQRENRKGLMSYCKGKKVLNTFCYSGGFSVYALGAGAKMVHSIDSSAKAIELCEKNVQLNFPNTKKHKGVCQDTLDFLKDTEENYDVIILDPPAYAKSKSAQHNAIQGYRRLNEQALKRINKGGILYTFSCSQTVHRQLFEDTIRAAAIDSNRTIRILEHLSQPADHSNSIFHPEGEYLKGLVLLIE